jgi:hypothetical protein
MEFGCGLCQIVRAYSSKSLTCTMRLILKNCFIAHRYFEVFIKYKAQVKAR